MGWFFSHGTRAELIRELTRNEGGELSSIKVLAYAVRGSVVWSVAETAKIDGAPRRFIRCDLLQRSGGQWGYKPMAEGDAPFYYHCPLRYLEMAAEVSREWRARVRDYHAAQAQTRALKRAQEAEWRRSMGVSR